MLVSHLPRSQTFFVAVLVCLPLWIMLQTLLNNNMTTVSRYTFIKTTLNSTLKDWGVLNGTVKSRLPHGQEPSIVSSPTINRTDFPCTRVSNTTLKTTVRKWWSVSSSRELFVFSAYFNRDRQVLEIVAIARVKTKIKAMCSFTASSNGTKRVVKGQLSILPEHHLKRYGAAVLTCPIGPDVPKLQSVTINVVANRKIEQVSLPVQYPDSTHAKVVNFTVCYPALHSNYLDAHELIQNIAANTLFGAARFFIYDHSIHRNLTTALNVIVGSEMLELIAWKIPVKDIHYYGQIAAAQDCLYRNRYTSRYIVFQDLDEFIVPRRPESWIQMMGRVSRDHPKAGSFVIRHSFFPKEWPDTATDSERKEEIHQNKLYVLYKSTRHYQINGYDRRSKMIVIPTRVKYMGIHSVPYHKKGFKGTQVKVNDALLQHYRYIKDMKDLPKGISKRIPSTAMNYYTRELVEMTSSIWRCVEEM